MADLRWLGDRGLAGAILRLAGQGTPVVGICGGYQMLGRRIRDPDRAESEVGELPGLGLVLADTPSAAHKATHQVRARLVGSPGWMAGLTETVLTGYEIHMGQTTTAS